jgi:electron transport complex protein RnfD
MEFPSYSSPHLSPASDVSLVMRRVLYALGPGLVCAWWFFGWGILFNVLLTSLTAVAAEGAMLRLRHRPVGQQLSDNSALLSGVLLGLALPPLAPWWVAVIGSLFAIVVAKQLYGGLGHNPFNPAMIGYVVVLISFPREMTYWPHAAGTGMRALSLIESLDWSLLGNLPQDVSLDALTRATPMDTAKTELGLGNTLSEIRTDPRFGGFGGHGFEWINLWFLIGGLWLLYTRTIRWQIPAGMLAALFGMSLIFFVSDPDTYLSPLFQLFSGATMLGAFFIATDPVSASTTPRGRIIYGAGIGIITFLIRTWGGYPEGIAFGVLLMNMAAPTIDYYTQPRVFGHRRDEE